jgi:hypothetical protein
MLKYFPAVLTFLYIWDISWPLGTFWVRLVLFSGFDIVHQKVWQDMPDERQPTSSVRCPPTFSRNRSQPQLLKNLRSRFRQRPQRLMKHRKPIL